MESRNTNQNRSTWKLRSFAGAFCLVVTCLWPVLALAQTNAFTYQGRFTDGGTATNGIYDMQFKLYDGKGNQIGSTITNGAVTVTNGVFTVQLDYGAAAFPGAERHLEIGLRLAGDANPYTVLSPRQQLTSAVYAIRAGSATTADNATNATNATNASNATNATNASQLGGVDASQYVQTNDARLSDARVPAPGSSNYIQNSTSPQASANFNVSGNGTAGGTLSANQVNVTTNYSIGGSSVLSVSGKGFGNLNNNTFTGIGAGLSNIPSENSTSGNFNSFFGGNAGAANTTGSRGSFFGYQAGKANQGGVANSFFGSSAGFGNTDGSFNSYFGEQAGSKATGNFNAFFGFNAGLQTTTGDANVFIGPSAGWSNQTGNSLTMIGNGANVGQFSLTNATAIGANAQVSQANSLVLGSIKSLNGATSDTNVGIGTTTPKALFHIGTNGGNIVMGNAGCVSGFTGIGFGSSLSGCTNYSLLGDGADTIINRPTGGAIHFRENNAPQMTISPGGAVSITTLGAAGSTQLCRNASNQISTCSSSLRYKTNIQPYFSGLSLLNRLRPITFDWKEGGMHDLGFGAEEVAAVEPLLATRNDKGEVEGVKYDRIAAVLVNAVKEQQEQIQKQQEQLAQQQSEIDALKQLIRRSHARTARRRH